MNWDREGNASVPRRFLEQTELPPRINETRWMFVVRPRRRALHPA